MAFSAGQHRVQEVRALNSRHNEIIDLILASVVILFNDVQSTGALVAAESVLARRPNVTTLDKEFSDVLSMRCVMPYKLRAFSADAPDRLPDGEENA